MITETAKQSILSAAKDYFPNTRSRNAFIRGFDTRVEVERAVAQLHRLVAASSSDPQVGYSFSEGHYPENFSGQPSVDKDKLRLDTPLRGVERVIDGQIETLMSTRSTDKPTVVFDFGGGLSVSMIRIAAKNREAIEEGRLVIGASNLGFVPSSEPDKNGYSGIAKAIYVLGESYDKPPYSNGELDRIQANQDLVAFVDATAEELPDCTIAPSVGNPVRFSDGVDIIHETDAIMHTHAPDLALYVFGRYLTPRGTLFLSAQKANYMQRPTLRTISLNEGREINFYTDQYAQGRRDALEVGIRLLQKVGYMKTYQGMRYSVFTGEEASDIRELIKSRG